MLRVSAIKPKNKDIFRFFNSLGSGGISTWWTNLVELGTSGVGFSEQQEYFAYA